MTLVCAYAPTLGADAAEKDLFYEDLRAIVPTIDKLFVLGNFNARTGTDYRGVTSLVCAV